MSRSCSWRSGRRDCTTGSFPSRRCGWCRRPSGRSRWTCPSDRRPSWGRRWRLPTRCTRWTWPFCWTRASRSFGSTARGTGATRTGWMRSSGLGTCSCSQSTVGMGIQNEFQSVSLTYKAHTQMCIYITQSNRSKEKPCVKLRYESLIGPNSFYFEVTTWSLDLKSLTNCGHKNMTFLIFLYLPWIL